MHGIVVFGAGHPPEVNQLLAVDVLLLSLRVGRINARLEWIDLFAHEALEAADADFRPVDGVSGAQMIEECNALLRMRTVIHCCGSEQRLIAAGDTSERAVCTSEQRSVQHVARVDGVLRDTDRIAQLLLELVLVGIIGSVDAESAKKEAKGWVGRACMDNVHLRAASEIAVVVDVALCDVA